MPTAYVCQVDTDGTAGVSGVHFTSLAGWYSAMRNGPGSGTLLLGSKNPIVVPGAITGTIANNATLTQLTTGATATLVHHTATQALLRLSTDAAIGGDDANPWRVDGSNYWTPSGARDLAVLTVDCRGATADASVIDWTKLHSQSNANPITVVGDRDPTSFAWDEAKFRWELSTTGGVITPANGQRNNLVFRNLQARNTSSSTATDAVCVYNGTGNAVLFDSCLLRGGKNAVYISGGQGRHVLHNTVAYGASNAAVLASSSAAAVIARNATLIGGLYGLRTNGGANCLAENTYAYGSTAAFSATGGGAITATDSASNDGTASTTTVAKSTATFVNVTAGSEDFGLPTGSPLIGAGADLSPGRTRYFADVSSASESSGTGAAPVGVLCFEVGSAVATFRLWDSVADKWFDGVDRPYDLSLSIPLPYASTTGDWIALVSDTHFGHAMKAVAGPGIDALNAGTKGRWNRATSGAWTNNAFPCTGRLLHLMNLGDIGPTDRSEYGTGLGLDNAGATVAQYRENMWNVSGLTTPPGAGCQSIPQNSSWHFTGNHDRTIAMTAPGFEAARLNQHGRTTSEYTGAAYADIDELHQHADIGNNRFLFLNYFGSGASGAWTSADTTWAKWAVSTLPASSNLFVLPHAPMTQSSRYSKSDQPHDTELEVALSMTAWAASFCGHCHGLTTPGSGPDWGSVATRQDYPTRSAWDVGAGLAPPSTPIRRPLRLRGRSLRGLRI